MAKRVALREGMVVVRKVRNRNYIILIEDFAWEFEMLKQNDKFIQRYARTAEDQKKYKKMRAWWGIDFDGRHTIVYESNDNVRLATKKEKFLWAAKQAL